MWSRSLDTVLRSHLSRTRLAIHGSFHFLESWLDVRDLGAVLDPKEPLPHPAEKQAH
jgi:hypothetical protein